MAEQRTSRQQRRHPSRANRMELRYVKSTIGPVLHADGVYGGLTPHGLVYLAFFSEHAKIPDSATLEQDSEGRAREVQEGNRPTEWVRDVGVEVTISLDVARSLRKWLDHKISESERRSPGNASAKVAPIEGHQSS